MATPFSADGAVDYPEAARLAQYLAAHGSDGLVVAGTTGESPTLSHDEKLRLFAAVKAAVGSETYVLAGTSGADTAASVLLSTEAAQTGVDGLLCVTPFYNRPSQEGLFQHFKAIADAAPLPVMLYNVPARTGVNLEPDTVLRLAEIENIIALKEAGNPQQAGDVTQFAPAGFAIYSGADENNLTVLALGGVGTVSVIGHVVGPDLAALHAAWFAGDLDKARALHLRTLPITKAMFCAPNPCRQKPPCKCWTFCPAAASACPL